MATYLRRQVSSGDSSSGSISRSNFQQHLLPALPWAPTKIINIHTAVFLEFELLKIHEYVRSEDEKCVLIAEQRASDTTREARIVLRPHQEDALEIAGEAKELLYGPGIEDLI
uniref:Uncharacterized protein n=1 Tax=Trichogramma kaykai TaxID=54128 RepID=A0ABD2W2T6_9HYME